jgi:carbamate kinase
VVPSPAPREIVEVPAIRACLREGLVVIAAGGGGVPVFNDKNVAKGVEAVIDKDLTSALLATQIGADLLVIVTGEPQVFLDFGRPGQRPVDRLTVPEARRHLEAGQFPEGSMGPKIQAALEFLAHGGPRAIITDRANLVRAVEGRAGTQIVPAEPPLLKNRTGPEPPDPYG